MPQYCLYDGEECRLDKALADFLPDLGLRGRRRMIENKAVLVYGIARKPAFVVKAGALITLLDQQEETTKAEHNTTLPPALADSPRALERQGKFAFFCKPAAMHSVPLAGKQGQSLEALLPNLAASLPPSDSASQELYLVQRLDYGTSGIVAAASTALAALDWRDMENRGLCAKRYLALMCGALPEPITATAALDVTNRRQTKVLESPAPALRHTQFVPLAQFAMDELAALCALAYPSGTSVETNTISLVGCCIHKGARHQIRAHAAGLGFPLWGDALYGGGDGIFFLHHAALRSALCHVILPPLWLDLLPKAAAHAAQQWLAQEPQEQS
jgi:23S rRNA pseudouridine1911/1915/1917 synthase